MIHRLRVFLVLLAPLILSAAPGGAQPVLEPCRQVLSQTIRWLRPGAVVTDGVLVVDAMRHQVLKIDFGGEVRSWSYEDPPEPISMPAIVRKNGGPPTEILIEDSSSDRIVKFTADGAYRDQFFLKRSFTGKRVGVHVKAAFDWVPYTEGYFGIFAYDTGTNSEAPDERGVVHLREDGTVAEPLRAFANNYSALPFYQRIPGTITVDPTQGFAYFIAPEGQVLRYSDDRSSWASFPVGNPLPRLGDLPHLRYPGAATRRALEHYREIETSYILTGLAYSGGSLYLLEREAVGLGRQPSWTLLQLDLESGAVKRRPFSSRAAQISLLASEEVLVFLEQSAVVGRGPDAAPERPVSSMVIVPSDRVSTLRGGPLPACGHVG